MDLNSKQWKLIIAALRHASTTYEAMSKLSAKAGRHDDSNKEFAFAAACGTLSDIIDKHIFGRSPRQPLIIRH